MAGGLEQGTDVRGQGTVGRLDGGAERHCLRAGRRCGATDGGGVYSPAKGRKANGCSIIWRDGGDVGAGWAERREKDEGSGGGAG